MQQNKTQRIDKTDFV